MADDVDVEDALEQLILGFRREFLQALRDARIALPPSEILALRLLRRKPGCSLQFLVQCTTRDKAQVTRLVRALEDKGLLRRERDPEDQRSFRLHLTAAGARLERRVRLVRASVHRRMLATLDARERERLRELLLRCVDALRG